MPTNTKKTTTTRKRVGSNVAQASETGAPKSSRVILDYALMPGIKAFKEMYQGNDVITIHRELFKAGLCSPLLQEWSTEKRTKIVLFYYHLQEALFELLDGIEDPA